MSRPSIKILKAALKQANEELRIICKSYQSHVKLSIWYRGSNGQSTTASVEESKLRMLDYRKQKKKKSEIEDLGKAIKTLSK